MARIQWKDLPNKTTPITAENLDKLNNLAIDTSVGEHEEEVVLVKTKNLISNDLKIGYVQDANTGKLVANANFTSTNYYIKVKPNTNYVFSGDSSITRVMRTEYDSSKTFNSKLSRVETRNNMTFKTQATTEYIIMAFNSTTKLNVQLEEGTTATTYDSWKASEIYANAEKYTDTLNIGVEPNNSGLWVEHNVVNIIDMKLFYQGYSLDTSGNKTSNSARSIIYLMPIKPDTTYTLSTSNVNIGAIFCYNNSKTYTNSILVSWDKTKTFTTPSNAYYISFALKNDSETTITYDQAKLQLEYGSTATTYEPYITPSIKVNNNGVYETIYDALQTGKGTKVHSSINLGDIFYYKLGKMVFVQIQDLQVSANINSNSSDTTILYDGLPINTGGEFGVVENYNNGSTAYTARLKVNGNDKLVLNYANLYTSQRYYGTFIYTTD